MMREIHDVNDPLRVYIAGPMESAGGNWNLPLFDYVAKKLREKGCEVYSPAEHLRDKHEFLENILAMDKLARKVARSMALKDEIIWIIDHAQLIFLLPGWERSPGAVAEHAIALACGVNVYESPNIVLPVDGTELDISLDLPAPAA